MLLQLMFFSWFIFPFIGTAALWFLLRRLNGSPRSVLSLVVWITPATIFAWLVYKSETGGADPDPLTFLQTWMGTSAMIAVLTIAGLEIVKAIRK